MKEILLTALDDNDSYWFDCLIPFMVSLEKTNYKGDIGVISYGLSNIKKEILKKNNILIFETKKYYDELVMDRQWMAANIGEEYNYDKVALYDSDIWFPNENLTIFSQIISDEKIYCNHDIFYSDFILKCVKEHKKEEVKEKIDNLIKINKKIWKAGLTVGKTSAWKKYREYMEKTITEKDFILKFGVDMTCIQLYSIEENGIEHLPNHYDCLPNGGLYITNISEDLKIMENYKFYLNGKEIEALHIPGPYRQWDGHYYDYVHWYGENYYREGVKYRLKKYEFKEISTEPLINICKEKLKDENTINLKIDKLYIESDLNLKIEGKDLLLITSGSFRTILKNKNEHNINLKIAVYEEFNYKLSKENFVTINGQYLQVKIKNKWFDLTLKPNDELVLGSYDLNPENTRTVWRLNNTNLE